MVKINVRDGVDLKVFGAEKIIKNHILEKKLCTYFVGFDVDDNGESQYRLSALIRLLINVIPEFAYGLHEGADTNIVDLAEILRNSAKSIYNIETFKKVRDIYVSGGSIGDEEIEDKYLKRGEFGELILHLLLRDFHDTIPLVSKIYFKDSFGSTVHGFDAVHIHEESKTLWLGESKLYTNGKSGVKELIKDIKEHFCSNYLESEFTIISRKIKGLDIAKKTDYWANLLNNSTSIKEQLDNITIPLLCTYESSVFSKHSDESTEGFINDYIREMRDLEKYFENNNDHPLKNRLNIVLLLFPVKSKRELVKRLHLNLNSMQNIGEL